jgi:hypothetical protein
MQVLIIDLETNTEYEVEIGLREEQLDILPLDQQNDVLEIYTICTLAEEYHETKH